LQEVDVIVAGILSTGVPSTSVDVERLKTLVLAENLKRAGTRTRIVEHRHHRQIRGEPASP
jgi:hypothetical protein